MADNKKISDADVKNALDALQSIQSSIGRSTDLFKELNKEASVYSTQTRDTVSRSTELNKIIKESEEILSKINKDVISQNTFNRVKSNIQGEIIKLQLKEQQIQKSLSFSQLTQAKLLQEYEEKYAKLLTSRDKINSEFLSKAEKLHKVEQKLLDLEKAGLQNSLKYNTAFQEYQRRSKSVEAIDLKRQDVNTQLKNVLEKVTASYKDQGISSFNLTKQQREAAENVLETFKNQEGAISKSNSALQKRNLLQEVFSRIPFLKNFSDAPGHMAKFGIQAGVALIAITAIVAAFKTLVEFVFGIDKQITDIANNLGLSKDGAALIRKEFQGISENSSFVNKSLDHSLLSISAQVDAMTQLNEAFGTANMYTQQQLQDQIFLTKQMGLEADQATKLQELAIVSNESADKATTSILNQVVALQKETGIRLNGRRVLQEVARIEGQLAAQYKNNPALIAQAVVQAQKFGLTLEEAKKSADSLLDFETSISNQLEAELLTGKHLNFERARALSLQGDSAAAASELLKQVGSLADYQKLNVITQESLAKSIGLSTDELAKTLRVQQVLRQTGSQTGKEYEKIRQEYIKIGREADFNRAVQVAANGEQLKAQLSQLSVQEKLSNAFDRLKEIFASIITDDLLKKVQSWTESFLKHLPTIIRYTKDLASIARAVLDPFIGIADLLKSLVQLLKGNVSGAGDSLVSAGKSFANIVPDLLNGVGGNLQRVHDSVIDNKGNVVISTPQGNITSDKNDSIITSTNPGGLLAPKSTNNQAVEQKLDKIIALIQQGGTINMDSKKLGTVMGLAYSTYK